MIRILIADDFPTMVRALELLIANQDDMEIAGEAADLPSALELLQQVDCDVILINDYIPPMDSVQATKLIRGEGIQIPILVMSMHEDAELAGQALLNGANGFIVKTEFLDTFTSAVRTVYRGDIYVSPRISALLDEEE